MTWLIKIEVETKEDAEQIEHSFECTHPIIDLEYEELD
tara:strand:- start:353 stop:466 length:114 start_codon:yes stop_codon:yes gene_type:complete